MNIRCSKRCAKPGPLDGLVLGADPVPEVDRRDRQPVVLVEDHGEAVVETVLLERDRDLLGWRHGDDGDAGHGDLADRVS